MDDVQPLVYVKLDPTQEEVLVEDDIEEDDVNIIEAFNVQWQIELEEGNDDVDGRYIHQCINDVEEMGAIIGEGAVGKEATGEEVVGKEAMVDALKELVPKEGVASPIIEVAILGGVRGVEEALATQVLSIDTLLEDIYELKYQLAQATSWMYRYRAER